MEHSWPSSPLSFKNHTFKQFLLKSDEVNSTQKLSVTGQKLAKNLNAMRREQQRHKCEWIEKIHEIGSPWDVSPLFSGNEGNPSRFHMTSPNLLSRLSSRYVLSVVFASFRWSTDREGGCWGRNTILEDSHSPGRGNKNTHCRITWQPTLCIP